VVNDPDLDGLPNECDPDPDSRSTGSPGGCPAGLTGPDEDQDCFSNRQDNCPLINQLEDPLSIASPDNKPNPKDSDSDGIGDACDVTSGGDPLFGNSLNGPEEADGEFLSLCASASVEIGAGASTAARQPTFDFNGPDCAEDDGTTDGATPTPTPTDGAGTPTPTNGGNGGLNGGPSDGIGSLAPVASSIPAWAVALSSLGGAGLLGGLGAFASRVFRRRR
jgi:hypothetical protein